MIAVARVPVRFPVAEGIGIFIGVAAWELLTVGELKLLEALLAGAACAASGAVLVAHRQIRA